MDPVEQWEQEEEEVAEVGLRGRLPCHPSSQKSTTTTRAVTPNGVESSSHHQKLNGKPESGIFFSKSRGTESIDGFNDSKEGNVDITPISETENLLAVSSLPPSNNGTEACESITFRKGSRQDETELYLDEFFKKPVAHKFFCPNCNSCIKKVVIRESGSDYASGPQPIDTFRCTSCFSFLIPAGEWFIHTFAPNEERIRWKEQETNVLQDPPSDSLLQRDSLVGTVYDRTTQPNKTLHDENGHAPTTNIVSSPVDMVGENLNFGMIKPQDASKDNVTFPKPDTLLQEKVKIDGGVSSTEAMRDGKTDEKHLQKLEPYKRPIIQGNVKDNFNAEQRGKYEKHLQKLEPDERPTIQANIKDNFNSEQSDKDVDYADEEHLQKLEPNERPTIQVNIKDNLNAEQSGKVVETTLLPSTPIFIVEDEQTIPSEPADDKNWVLKSIVYGGLTETITSLIVVTSAASADVTTMNILALALASLVGGLFIIGQNLWELKNEQSGRGTSDQTNGREDRYEDLLGKRQNFILHAPVAILSFVVFGLIPPVVYAFSFQKSDNKHYTLAAVAAASLLCIVVLAIVKGYVQKPPQNCIITILLYAVVGVMASGVSFVAGDQLKKLIEKHGWFKSEVAVVMPLAEMNSGRLAWATY
ncbi:membrane protein of ER body-like protein isoform X2 [Hevea brasiliensis]|uniref:membrane protein of ER body-like protein isoform X2 n=1 Tax=Hevea brasiliensis TaxID=3981 RepID=UPI0025EB14AF|nr:membrane protein of ER body-like protein isoform X2 [Hevea brasiliensis]